MARIIEEDIMSENTGGGIEVALTRMEGKIDRINDRLSRNERDYTTLNTRVETLALEVANLKTSATARDNFSKGATTTLKALWAVLGAIGASGILIIARIISKGAI